MGWWPFGKKRESSRFTNNDPLLKDTRTWIGELRDACEKNFDQPEEARRQIRQMQVEWTDSHQKGDVSNELLAGLDRRCFRLLRADADEWLKWLDDEDFWAPGWGIESTE